jgi:glutamate synthase (NADPH/NADH) large chain
MKNQECQHSRSGLYDPRDEHDACGIGFVANLSGEPTQEIIGQALEILVRLDHRGGCGCDPESGDGAGLLMQLPHEFLSARAKELNISLPAAGRYGVAQVFLPTDAQARSLCVKALESACSQAGLRPLGWRELPVDASECGQGSLATKPDMAQLFAEATDEIDEDALERRLYVARKIAENTLAAEHPEAAKWFYVCSFSARTIIYKGMLTTSQLPGFFPDLLDPMTKSALALVHSRFSTNTLPSWRLAQPFRYVAHNGEINTVRGNINWMSARETLFRSDLFDVEMAKLLPTIPGGQSDSAAFDNALELLSQTGRSLPHAISMMIPEAWEKHEAMSDEKRDFYRYHSSLVEPWDGPASIAFTDGRRIGAVLDRNGLRPSRYLVTKDGLVVMASETGVLDIDPENVLLKERLQPGRTFLVDLVEKRIIEDSEIKHSLASAKPYGKWLEEQTIGLEDLPDPKSVPGTIAGDDLDRAQAMFGFTSEDISVLLVPMALNGQEPVGSMGTDTPLACLSDQPQLTFNYFKQIFAQVTNPPVDPIREELIMSLDTTTGCQGNLFEETPELCRQLSLGQPILTNEQLSQIREIDCHGIHSQTLSITFPAGGDGEALTTAIERVCKEAEAAVKSGAEIVILSDRTASAEHAAIPSLLAVGAVHHHLIRSGLRTKTGIVLESGEPREVMHFALLVGYGASAINPYVALDTLVDLAGERQLHGHSEQEARNNYIKAIGKGLYKTMSKMGISTLASYRGAQIFEAIGLRDEVINRCFTWTRSRIQGVGFDILAKEVEMRHGRAWRPAVPDDNGLLPGGQYQWRRRGEFHLFNPETVAKLQHSVRSGSYKTFKTYARAVNEQEKHLCTLRSLLDFKPGETPVPLEEVEPASEIVKRFKTGAMSYGSISREAHTTLAVAMNRIGGRSNTGEGGEEEDRFTPLPNGDSMRSAIKQVASGRFGVTINYLTNADEIQIKMAQGAKPGEGGQLPGHKVDEVIAKTRHSTPGVGLISPPPHHDIYSIEDLAQLIHDLKNSNPAARVAVKLVSEGGVGTIAAGVSKAKADVVLISGHDGGTGASPLSSLKHAGGPWELGLAETQQVLVQNDLRSRIRVETDGQLKTGRDVAIAAMLGADEFGFATAALVAEGCIMMRKCHLNTCPVGIATQDKELRKRFEGEPEHVINFMLFVAEELREYMAAAGFRTIAEMTGRVDRLKVRDNITHWKAKHIDLSAILYRPEVPATVGISGTGSQDHGLENALDNEIIKLTSAAIRDKTPVEVSLPILNTNRTVGTTLSHEITKIHGAEGLPPYTIQLHFEGSAGQSFASFLAPGISADIAGDANDYFCKGMSGGQVVIRPPHTATFVPEENIIIGNVAMYGATAGEVFIRGRAGERFAVRNSGATAVVEGIGDHGCEYMTGGYVVCLGSTGRNFGAGMSGGIAYVYDPQDNFDKNCNRGMVELLRTEEDDAKILHQLLTRHVQYTQSTVAESLLANWDDAVKHFTKVMPTEYRRVLEAMHLDSESEKLAAI